MSECVGRRTSAAAHSHTRKKVRHVHRAAKQQQQDAEVGGATEGPRVCSLQGRPAGTAWRTWRTSAARATAAREESVQQWAEQGVGGSMRAQAQLQARRTTRRSARGWRRGQAVGGHSEQESGRTYGRRRGAPARGGPRPPPRLHHGAARHGGDAQIARQLQGGQAPHTRWTLGAARAGLGGRRPLQVQVRSSGRPQNNAQTPGTSDQHDVEGRSAGAGGGAAHAEQPRLDSAGGGAGTPRARVSPRPPCAAPSARSFEALFKPPRLWRPSTPLHLPAQMRSRAGPATLAWTPAREPC